MIGLGKTISSLRVILSVITLTIVMLLTSAVPARADSTPTTLTLLSGATTQTAGYTYNNPYYQADTFVSGNATQTAGYSTANVSGDPLNVNLYSYQSWQTASLITDLASPWTSISGASWVSTTANYSGTENGYKGDSWRLLRATFTVATSPAPTAAYIQIAADNAFELYLNGSFLATTDTWNPQATVYGHSPDPEPGGTMIPFEESATIQLPLPLLASNTLLFVVRNWDNGDNDNPTGLLYKITVQYAVTQQQLNPSTYSGGGSWFTAPHVTTLPDPWVKPAWGAYWVSTTADYSGTDNNNGSDSWRLYRDQFTIPGGAAISTASIQIAGDNAYDIYLNGNLVASTADFNPVATVYGDSPEPGGTTVPYAQVATFTFTPTTGVNTLMFVVRNWDNGDGNPTGLLYKTSITYTTGGPFTPVATVGGTVFPVKKLQVLWNYLASTLYLPLNP